MLGVVWARWVVGSLGLSDSFFLGSLLLFGLILSLISLDWLVVFIWHFGFDVLRGWA